MTSEYEFLESIIARIPLLPLNSDGSSQIFRESVFIASPNVAENMDNPGFNLTVRKYLKRSSYRCTPFGLFAGCSVVTWGKTTEFTIDSETKKVFQRKTHIDVLLFKGVLDFFIKKYRIEKTSKYYSNSSMYKIGNKYRYVEWVDKQNEQRLFEVSEIDSNDVIDQIINLCKNGKYEGELIKFLSELSFQNEDAKEFIEELIKNKIVVSEIDVNLTGDEFFHNFITYLNKLRAQLSPEFAADLDKLVTIEGQLNSLDESKVNNIDAYKSIISTLRSFCPDLQDNKVFHVDKFDSGIKGTIDSAIKMKLLKTLNLLRVFSFGAERPDLITFKKHFLRKYGESAVPLTEALDTELGIGYASLGTQLYSDLLKDISFRESNEDSLMLPTIQVFLLRKVQQCILDGKNVIELSELDLDFFSGVMKKKRVTRQPKFEDSFYLLFRLLKTGQARIQFMVAHGASAMNMIGRFASSFSSVGKIAKEICDDEQKNRHDTILVEIVHLPDHRIGNLINRPLLRQYEIPYLGKSGAPSDKQVFVDDITVQLVDNRIILRAKNLDNAVIVPRLSNAHNFHLSSLPIYRFLCDVQSDQALEKIAFDWGNLGNMMNYFPRVEFDGVILSPETWIFQKIEFEHILKNPTVELPIFLKKWRCPKMLILAEGDQELPLNLDNEIDLLIFLEHLKKRDVVNLVEYLYLDPDTCFLKDEKGNSYNHELLAFLKSTDNNRIPQSSNASIQTHVKRDFLPGSEWVYYKVYCGDQQADRVLTEALFPLCQELIKEGLISKWFFIRYADDDPHLRLRLCVSQFGDVSSPIILKCLKTFERLIESKLAWKIQCDTYSRELERYGYARIETCESIFYHDSCSVCEFLTIKMEQEVSEAQRWQFGVVMVDTLLNLFEISLNDKYEITNIWKENYYWEFNVGRNQKKTLDDKYRIYRETILQLLSGNFMELSSELSQVLEFRNTKIRNELTEFRSPDGTLNLSELSTALSGIVHMSLNRICNTRQRPHELVIYDFLNRSYKSLMKRLK